MKLNSYRPVVMAVATAILGALLFSPHSPAVNSLEAQSSSFNALYLSTVPEEYKKLEETFASFKESGANTVMLKPRIRNGVIDRDALTNVVFLSHQAGLKIFVIVPTRSLDVIQFHPDWEDMRCDLGSGALQPTGRLDLFNPSVVIFLTGLFKELAAYSVDGILLDQDFFYSDVEGAGPSALAAYRQKFGSRLSFSKAFLKVEGADVLSVEEYGECFWNWNELKKNTIKDALQTITQTVRAVNGSIKIGIPLHLPGVVRPIDDRAHYSYDMFTFRRSDIDFFWIPVLHRDIRARQSLSYKRSIEIFSQTVQEAAALVKDPARTIIAMQTVSESGRPLPFHEIEMVFNQARKAGEPGIALIVETDKLLPAILTQKMYKRQQD